MNQTEIKSSTRFLPVPAWNKYHEWPSVAGLRYLIFNEKTNGFDHVVVRSGRRVLINEQAFFEWLESNRRGGSK